MPLARPILAVTSLLALPALADPFVTEGERSGYLRTGRHDEVQRICAAAAAAEPRRARCLTFGESPEGRPMLALALSQDGVLDPAAARRRGRPVILVQGGIHAGEIEGKDAIFSSARELLAGTMAPGALAAATIVFVPVYNVDGHERFGRNNRPNQRGPEEMGFRATAQNLNLNRDYMKADAPETRAMLALLEAWDPAVYVDLHTTDGAKFEHDISVTLAPETPRHDGLPAVVGALSEAIQTRLTAAGHLPLPFYPDFRTNDDPTSGFATEDSPPRFSTGYAAARNRIGVLVETHSWRTYRERVAATHDALAAIFERAAAGDALRWRDAGRAADAAERKLAGADVVLTVEMDGTPRLVDFRGYAYLKAPSEISGQDFITYDERKPQIWRVPVFDKMRPKLTVRAPLGGYLVPRAQAALVADLLRVHGLAFRTLRAAHPGLAVERYHIDGLDQGKPFEGRVPTAVTGGWRPAQRDVAAGALFVPIDQPRALLVMHLLEPEAPDSFVSWGFFNALFEQKEYMEAYVAEAEARRMLAADPALRADFERRLAEDKDFAASPERRLAFFSRRHPSWDDERMWAPVLRVAAAPE